MQKKNLNLKKSLKPISEEELESAAGGGKPTLFGCCAQGGIAATFSRLNLSTGQCENRGCP